MRWKRGWLWALSVALVLLTALLGAHYLMPQKTLIIGVDPSFPPFESRNETGQFVGYDIDLAKAIAKQLKCKIEFKEIAFRDLLPSLQAGRVQLVISGLPIRADRELLADFTAPYYDATQVVVMLAIDQRHPTRPEDLAKWRLAAQVGTTGAFEAEYIKGSDQEPSLLELSEPADLFSALLKREIDAVIVDRQLAHRYAAVDQSMKVLSVGFGEEQYGIAVPKNQQQLLSEVNSALVDWLASPNGEQALEEWLGPK